MPVRFEHWIFKSSRGYHEICRRIARGLLDGFQMEVTHGSKYGCQKAVSVLPEGYSRVARELLEFTKRGTRGLQ